MPPAVFILVAPITRLGGRLLAWSRDWLDLARFAAGAVLVALNPATYNSATRSVVYKQIYFTAGQILGQFTLFAALMSFVVIQIVVSTARDYGLSEFALEVVLRLLVLEVLPLLTALFVALRSGAAINAEVALMHIHDEIEALRQSGVDPMHFEFIPRVIGGSLSVLALTASSSLITLVLAYLAVYGLQPWSLADFNRVFGEVFDPFTVLVLWLKILLFGLAVTVIPITAGLSTPKKLFFAPISMLRGMVRLFFVLMLIEVGSLALKYI